MVIQSVTFFGSSLDEPGSVHFESARAVAKAIAESERRVVNGGGPGIMLAATLGAKEGNGKTTVVYYRPELVKNFEGKNAANFADKQYEESNYVLRTKKLLELGDAYIVFNGGTGTISEFAMAWGVARLYIGHHKPLLLYGEFWHHLMNDFKKHMMIRPEELEVFTIVNSATEVLNALEKYEKVIESNLQKHAQCKGPECKFML